MAHGYRTLQHWNQWLSHSFLGAHLLDEEAKSLSNLLAKHFGKHAVLVGVPHQDDLLKATAIPIHSLLTPLVSTKNTSHLIEGDFHEFPILSGSVDLVLLPHALEFVDNPRQLLSEACRIVKPEGLIVICGFNPLSIWGLNKIMVKHKETPWEGNFIHAQKIKNWLHLADFEMEKQVSLLFRPPLQNQKTFAKLHFMENIGEKCLPGLGGAYILLARAKVVPLTPIRLKWKQQLNGIRISTTISGHVARKDRILNRVQDDFYLE